MKILILTIGGVLVGVLTELLFGLQGIGGMVIGYVWGSIVWLFIL